MEPNYEKAASKAAEVLIRFGISSAPVSPLPILKKTRGVLVFSYGALSDALEQDRSRVLDLFGGQNRDAFTSVNIHDGKPQYIVTYNQRLSQVLIQRALARELGHIVLGHDGTRPEEVRNAEALCFAHHLLSPRPLLNAILQSGVRLTVDVLGNLTGCYDHCLRCMRSLPGVRVSPELNRMVRDQFMDFFLDFFDYQRVYTHQDGSALADLGTFMDGYEE